MQGSLKSVYECIKAFSETDFTEDLKKFDVPTSLLHGPGITATQPDRVNADLLEFMEKGRKTPKWLEALRAI